MALDTCFDYAHAENPNGDSKRDSHSREIWFSNRDVMWRVTGWHCRGLMKRMHRAFMILSGILIAIHCNN